MPAARGRKTYVPGLFLFHSSFPMAKDFIPAQHVEFPTFHQAFRLKFTPVFEEVFRDSGLCCCEAFIESAPAPEISIALRKAAHPDKGDTTLPL
jgi:hypothetical protein